MKSYETLNLDIIALEDEPIVSSNVAHSGYAQFQAGFNAFGFLDDEGE